MPCVTSFMQMSEAKYADAASNFTILIAAALDYQDSLVPSHFLRRNISGAGGRFRRLIAGRHYLRFPRFHTFPPIIAVVSISF